MKVAEYAAFDKLLSEQDKVVYNLVALIREQNGARLYTDGKSYLTAQTNADCPMWIYVNGQADKKTEQELLFVLSEALKENPRFAVNAQEGFAENVLSLLAKQHGLTFCKSKPLNAYFIREVRDIKPVGKIIVATEQYEKEIATLVRQMMMDDGHGDMNEEEAMQFAKAHVDTGDLYLWVQEKPVSMARIIRYGAKYARLTSVVTERTARGNGYAKMLVGELSSKLIQEGLTPVLYARSENASSNRCYQTIGFEKAGEICEFRME